MKKTWTYTDTKGLNHKYEQNEEIYTNINA